MKLSFIDKIAPSWRADRITPLFVLFMIVFGIWIYAYYPGLMPFDTAQQINNFMTGQYLLSGVSDADGNITGSIVHEGIWTHHPVFVTYIYGAFATVGWTLFGSISAGILICSIVQALLAAIVLSSSICYLSELEVPAPARLIIAIIALLLPAIAIQSVQIGKDGLFGIFFLIWMMFVIAIVESHGKRMEENGFWVIFCLLGILCGLCKSIGFAVIAASLIILAIIYHKTLFQWIICCVLAIVVPLSFVPLLSNFVEMSDSDSRQEAFGIMYQQTALYTIEHGDERSAEDIAAIDGVLKYDRLASEYCAGLTDNVKNMYRGDDEVSDEDWAAYLEVYKKEFLKHPDTYKTASLAVLSEYLHSGYIAGQENTVRYDIDDETINYLSEKTGMSIAELEEKLLGENKVDLSVSDSEMMTWLIEHGKLQDYTVPENWIDSLFPDLKPAMAYPEMNSLRMAIMTAPATLESIPVIGLLADKFFFAVLLPLITFMVLLVCDRRRLPIMVPIIMCQLSLLACPCSVTRYISPLIMVSPVLAGVIVAAIVRFISAAKGKVAGIDAKIKERNFTPEEEYHIQHPTPAELRAQEAGYTIDSNFAAQMGEENIPEESKPSNIETPQFLDEHEEIQEQTGLKGLMAKATAAAAAGTVAIKGAFDSIKTKNDASQPSENPFDDNQYDNQNIQTSDMQEAPNTYPEAQENVVPAFTPQPTRTYVPTAVAIQHEFIDTPDGDLARELSYEPLQYAPSKRATYIPPEPVAEPLGEEPIERYFMNQTPNVAAQVSNNDTSSQIEPVPLDFWNENLHISENVSTAEDLTTREWDYAVPSEIDIADIPLESAPMNPAKSTSSIEEFPETQFISDTDAAKDLTSTFDPIDAFKEQLESKKQGSAASATMSEKEAHKTSLPSTEELLNQVLGKKK